MDSVLKTKLNLCRILVLSAQSTSGDLSHHHQ